MTTDPHIDEAARIAIPVPEVEDIDPTTLTNEQRAGYEKTLEISRKAAKTLTKLAKGASKEANVPSIRLTAHDCWDFMTWITTIQNIADMQQQKIDHMEQVIAGQAGALAQYEQKTGKKLWRPGPA